MNITKSRTSEYADFYAYHLWRLIQVADFWIKRRVISCTVVDGDTLQFHASVDFDLTECDVGRKYLKETRGNCLYRPRRPVLVPIGLYRDPHVGFDIRDNGGSRISFVAKEERDEITKLIRKNGRAKRGAGALFGIADQYGLAMGIVELPSDDSCSSGRGVLNYTYLGRWRKDREAFSFLPKEEPRRDLRFYSGEWWRRERMLLGWSPMRVVIPLWNMRFSQSLHVELETPEGIRIHEPGIFAEQGSDQLRMPGEEGIRDVPPARSCSVVHYRFLKDFYPKLADGQLAFRAWLSLDRSFVRVLLFLATLSTATSIGAIAPFMFTKFDMTGLVTVQALAAAAALAYLYVPGEHGLSRGLYYPLRVVSVTIAALGLLIAGALAVLEPDQSHVASQFPFSGIYGIAFFAITVLATPMLFGTAILLVSFAKVNDKRVRKWLSRHRCQYKQFGWHIEGLRFRAGIIPSPAVVIELPLAIEITPICARAKLATADSPTAHIGRSGAAGASATVTLSDATGRQRADSDDRQPTAAHGSGT